MVLFKASSAFRSGRLTAGTIIWVLEDLRECQSTAARVGRAPGNTWARRCLSATTQVVAAITAVRSKGRRKVRLAAANGSPIHVEGEATLNFKRNGRQCEMKFLDADVRRPLAAVGAIVDEGNTVVFSAQGAYIQNDTTKERIPMIRRVASSCWKSRRARRTARWG